MFTSVDEISVKLCLSVGYVQSNLVYQLVFTVKPCLSVGLYSKTLFISWFLQSNLVYQLVFTVEPCLSVGFYSRTLFISWFLQSNLIYQSVCTVKHSLSEPHQWRRSWVRALVGSNQRQKIGICCFSAKHAALRRKNKDWLVRNQDNVS